MIYLGSVDVFAEVIGLGLDGYEFCAINCPEMMRPQLQALIANFLAVIVVGRREKVESRARIG